MLELAGDRGLAAIRPAALVASPAAYDRFARWPAWAARAVLALLLVLLVASASVEISRNRGPDFVPGLVSGGPAKAQLRDDDLTVYDHVIVRLQKGESYYPAVAAEHRLVGFPLTPGLAVRLPTLVWFYAAIGERGEQAFAVLLLMLVLIVWWRRLGCEPATADRRALAMALVALNAVLVLNVYFYRLHELPSGMLLAIGIGLYRPGKWFPAIVPIAAALAMRELVLPFVLLLGAMAAWRRDWRETMVWSALAAAFALLLAVHLHLVAQQVQPGDFVSKSWFAFRGLSGWLEAMIFSSNLRYLPPVVAGPVVVFALFGWAGLRTSLGAFMTLLLGGYAVFFAIAGRDENYYWGMLVTPVFILGLLFVPMAAKGLFRAAIAR